MKKIEIKEISSEAEEVFDLFAKQSGSEHIASVNAIEALYQILLADKPKRIVEFGGGIGTMDYLCLRNSNAFVDVFEDNDFCIKKLSENLNGYNGRYKIYKEKKNFKIKQDYFNLVIVDGSWESLVDEFINRTKKIDKIFFEGRRTGAQICFLNALKRKYVVRYTRYYNSSNNYKNAYLISCKLCSSGLLRQLSYFYNRSLFELENMRIYGVFSYVKCKLYSCNIVKLVSNYKNYIKQKINDL